MKKIFKIAVLSLALAVSILLTNNGVKVEAIGKKADYNDIIIQSSGPNWVDIGTELPKTVDYEDDDRSGKTTLLDIVQPGDIFYTPNGSSYIFGNTGHVAIIEGVFYDKKYHQWYIRTIEANNPCGVKRGCLTKERFKESGGGTIIRVKGVSQEEINTAVQFCVDQLNKGYELNVFRYPHITGDKWYCSELAWAAYYNATNERISIDPFWDGGNMVVWPEDITKSCYVECIDITKYYHTIGSHHKKVVNGCFFDEICTFHNNRCKMCGYKPGC